MQYGSKKSRLPRADALQRLSDDVHALYGAVPEPRRLLGVPARALLPRRLRVPQVQAPDEVPPDQVPRGLLLPMVRATGLSHSGHDLPQEHHEPAALVLGDLPNVLDAL